MGPWRSIGYDFWQKRFGGAADAIGKTVTLQRKPFTIIGVLPPRFLGPEIGWSADIIIPVSATAVLRGGSTSMLDQRSTWWLDVMARLKPGQTMEQATQVLRGVQPAVKDATRAARLVEGRPEQLPERAVHAHPRVERRVGLCARGSSGR